MRRIHILILCFFVAACRPSPPSAPVRPPASQPKAVLPSPDQRYDGPPVNMTTLISDEDSAPVNVVTVSAEAPTGGWTMTVDRGERSGGLLRVYVTLTPPSPGDLVNQSITHISTDYREPYQAISTIELHVKVAGSDADYRFARRKPDL
jgi:hypothetical protein